MKAASSGPIAGPALPPTWKSDCARPCRPPEARRAMREDSGWKTAEPKPIMQAPSTRTSEAVGIAEHDQAEEGARHADRQRIGHRPAIGDQSDHRLQQRGGDLEGQRQQADLDEIEIVIRLEQRIERRQQRLHDVVDQMAEADRHHDRNRRLLKSGLACPKMPQPLGFLPAPANPPAIVDRLLHGLRVTFFRVLVQFFRDWAKMENSLNSCATLGQEPRATSAGWTTPKLTYSSTAPSPAGYTVPSTSIAAHSCSASSPACGWSSTRGRWMVPPATRS